MHLQWWWPIFLAIPKLRITDSWWATCFKFFRCLGAIWLWKYTSRIAMWIIFLTILVQWARSKENDSIRTSKRWKRGIKGTGVRAWRLATASVWYASARTLNTLGEPEKENSCLRYVSSLRYVKPLALFCLISWTYISYGVSVLCYATWIGTLYEHKWQFCKKNWPVTEILSLFLKLDLRDLTNWGWHLHLRNQRS